MVELQVKCYGHMLARSSQCNRAWASRLWILVSSPSTGRNLLCRVKLFSSILLNHAERWRQLCNNGLGLRWWNIEVPPPVLSLSLMNSVRCWSNQVKSSQIISRLLAIRASLETPAYNRNPTINHEQYWNWGAGKKQPLIGRNLGQIKKTNGRLNSWFLILLYACLLPPNLISHVLLPNSSCTFPQMWI